MCPAGPRGYVPAGKLQPYHLDQSQKPRMQTLAPDDRAERRRHSYTFPEAPRPPVPIVTPASQVGVGNIAAACLFINRFIVSVSVHISAQVHMQAHTAGTTIHQYLCICACALQLPEELGSDNRLAQGPATWYSLSVSSHRLMLQKKGLFLSPPLMYTYFYMQLSHLV